VRSTLGTVWTNTWFAMNAGFEEGGYKQSGLGRCAAPVVSRTSKRSRLTSTWCHPRVTETNSQGMFLADSASSHRCRAYDSWRQGPFGSDPAARRTALLQRKLVSIGHELGTNLTDQLQQSPDWQPKSNL
jgi:hypothetical protein